jgi:hypothetical protein
MLRSSTSKLSPDAALVSRTASAMESPAFTISRVSVARGAQEDVEVTHALVWATCEPEDVYSVNTRQTRLPGVSLRSHPLAEYWAPAAALVTGLLVVRRPKVLAPLFAADAAQFPVCASDATDKVAVTGDHPDVEPVSKSPFTRRFGPAAPADGTETPISATTDSGTTSMILRMILPVV